MHREANRRENCTLHPSLISGLNFLFSLASPFSLVCLALLGVPRPSSLIHTNCKGRAFSLPLSFPFLPLSLASLSLVTFNLDIICRTNECFTYARRNIVRSQRSRFNWERMKNCGKRPSIWHAPSLSRPAAPRG